MGRDYESQSVTVGTLARTLSTTHGVSEHLAFALLRESVGIISDALVEGRRVHLAGLGTFKTKNYKGMDHTTHFGKINVPERARPVFRPAKCLTGLPPRVDLPEPRPSLMDECPM